MAVSDNIVGGNMVSVDVAAANRRYLEQQVTTQLPDDTVLVDASIRFKSGQTIIGPAILNAHVASDYRTIDSRGEGIGYYDPLTVTGANEVTLADKSQTIYYKPGMPAYFYRVDSFVTNQSQLRTLHGIASSDPATGKIKLLGPTLDSRLNAGKWYERAATIGDVVEGASSLVVQSPDLCTVGDWVLLTQGPEPYNESRGEWHRILNTSPSGRKQQRVFLDTPTFRSYNAAVLAVARPVTGVVFQNFTASMPVGASPYETVFLKFWVGGKLQSITVDGYADLANCAYVMFKDCNFQNCALNSCHHCIFVNCTFGTIRLEECCFSNDFVNCTIEESFGMSTPADKITLRGCTVSGAGAYMGMDGNDNLIDCLNIVDGDANNIGLYLKGDRCTVRNVTADCGVWAQIGYGHQLSNIVATKVLLGWTGNPSSGYIMGSSVIPTIQTGSWQILP